MNTPKIRTGGGLRDLVGDVRDELDEQGAVEQPALIEARPPTTNAKPRKTMDRKMLKLSGRHGSCHQ